MEILAARHIDLERHKWPVRLIRIFTVPILNAISPNFLQWLIRKYSPYGRGVIEKPGTSHSLEVMYGRKPGRISDLFWHNFVSQPKAVRNRLKIVKHHLEREISDGLNNKERLDILNIGGGSSRAFLEVISEIKESNRITVTTLDLDESALELGKKKAIERGIEGSFKWIRGDARNLGDYLGPDSMDIVEMVGLLDYFTVEKSGPILTSVYRVLRPGGIFLLGNVFPNREMKFVRNVGWPEMFYKTEHEMHALLKEAGFADEHITLILEPLGVHIVAIAKK